MRFHPFLLVCFVAMQVLGTPVLAGSNANLQFYLANLEGHTYSSQQMTEPLIAQSLSCTSRLTCGRIPSCQAALWYLSNCSWGGRLDRDRDGRPCENGPC